MVMTGSADNHPRDRGVGVNPVRPVCRLSRVGTGVASPARGHRPWPAPFALSEVIVRACLDFSDLDAHLPSHDQGGLEPVCASLHGLGWSSSSDHPPIVRHPRLAPYRAILIDFLGFGFRDRPDAFPHTPEAHAAVVAYLLDHLGPRGCHVVGHGLGGSIAIVLAAARSDLVAGLVAIEPNLDPKDATLSRTIPDQPEEDYLATGHAALIAQAEGCAAGDPGIASYPGTPRAAARGMHRSATALVASTVREAFFALRLPRTDVFGARTLPHPHEALLRAAAVVVVVVPDAGHDLLVANSEGVALALTGTLP